jgi:hypothetical protein
MQVDKIVLALEDQPPPPPDKNDKSRYLFTVKVVQAENLVSLDNNPSAMLDTFVVLSDEHGSKLAKTKTIYDTVNPRCECVLLTMVILIYDYLLKGRRRLISR